MTTQPKQVSQEQINRIVGGLPDLLLIDRAALERLLNDDQGLATCRQLLADDLASCIQQSDPDATVYGYNRDWKPKTLEQLVQFWASHDPEMQVSVPKSITLPKGCVIGIIPKFAYLKRRFGVDATTPDGHAKLLFQTFEKIAEQRQAYNILAKRQDAQFWQVDAAAMQARLALENEIPGDALVVPIDMGKGTARRRIVDVENDITGHLKSWLYGVGTPLDIACLLLADGGNLQKFDDLWIRSLWVRFRGWSDGPWRCPRFYIYDDGSLCLDHGRAADANDYYGAVVAHPAAI